VRDATGKMIALCASMEVAKVFVSPEKKSVGKKVAKKVSKKKKRGT
jgi:hypothetical protein